MPYPRYPRYRKLSQQAPGSKFVAYLNRVIARLTGSASNFAISATVASNGLTITGHNLSVGDGPLRLTAAGTGTVLAALNTTTDVYVRSVVDANTVTLSPLPDLSTVLTVAAGAGTGTLARTLTPASITRALRRRGFSRVNTVTDIDNV